MPKKRSVEIQILTAVNKFDKIFTYVIYIYVMSSIYKPLPPNTAEYTFLSRVPRILT